MKKSLMYLLLSVSIIAFSSCEKNDVDPFEGKHYMPLSVGNSWTYSNDIDE